MNKRIENMLALPSRFCWTKYGAEAGEPAGAIFARKERERASDGGIFLWGIGNSVAPGIRALVRLEQRPLVVFSPMLAKAKLADASPSSIVRWTRARDLNGEWWLMPAASMVTSRGSTARREKATHYALVCKSDIALTSQQPLYCPLSFESLSNLESGNPLGFSQVTSVVEMSAAPRGQRRYPVGFVAELTYPYFVELHDPVEVGRKAEAQGRLRGHQPSLIWAR